MLLENVLLIYNKEYNEWGRGVKTVTLTVAQQAAKTENLLNNLENLLRNLLNQHCTVKGPGQFTRLFLRT